MKYRVFTTLSVEMVADFKPVTKQYINQAI